MKGNEIRESYLRFFEGKGHLRLASASLVPAGDPTLLFTSAGMAPLKDYYTGRMTPPNRRLTSCQKCMRTSDLDSVGDASHLTFFEMLGNFSIGDYFKEEAIEWAWEYVTQHLRLPVDRLYATIYLDDDESFRIWNERIGVPADRIYRYGDKSNFWGPAGTEGPCGPCSEIHYDRGVEAGCGQPIALPGHEHEGGCHPDHGCGRFLELWNLVFTQFYHHPDGTRTDLPAPNIDTGMGLERTAQVMQGKDSVYESDLFWPIVARVCQVAGKEYGEDREVDRAIRVVAEHSRAVPFLIADGVVPGNQGRGYVLRRIIRRAIRFGRRLGVQRPFLREVADATVGLFGDTYKELKEQREFVLRVVGMEEERFAEAFERGLGFLEYLVDLSKPGVPPSPRVYINNADRAWGYSMASNTSGTARQTRVISGADMFFLWDTLGFPPEETQEIAREHGLDVDMDGFQRELEKRREQSRAGAAFTGDMAILTAYEGLGVEKVRFTGYDETTTATRIVGILMDGEAVGHASQGQEVEIVLEGTPFYAEMGGQVADTGVIEGPRGRVAVSHVHAPIEGLTVHRGIVQEGEVSLGDEVQAKVDVERRLDIARNHTATHLLHAALRRVLGTHVRQAGSLVAPDRFRFDFTHVVPMSREELLEVRRIVNDAIRADLPVTRTEAPLSEATKQGALAFFGDKYGERVWTVRIGNEETFSMEVCGGTHLHRTGQIGSFHITSESGIGGGLRRIEAVTGRGADELALRNEALLERLSQKLETPVQDLESRIETLQAEMSGLRRQLQAAERKSLRDEAQELLDRAQQVDGVSVLAERFSATSVEGLREVGDWLRDKLGSAVVGLGAVVDDRPVLVVMLTSDLVKRGLHAGRIAGEAARVMGGGGGGRPDVAQAGGRQKEKLDAALKAIPGLVRKAAS